MKCDNFNLTIAEFRYLIPSKQEPLSGFTLVELMLCLVIANLMAAILYTALAPVRERARESRCLSNLHQIGIAIQMYRQDYGGQDATGGPMTVAQLGLPQPPAPWHLKTYLPNADVWKCQSVHYEDGMDPDRAITHYADFIQPEEEITPPELRFSELVARRGTETPLFCDYYHGTFKHPMIPRPPADLILILRLSGQVQRRMVPDGEPYWKM